MTKIGRASRALIIGVSGLTLLAAGAASAQEADDIAALTEALRTEFSKYQDVNVALADGYIPDPTGMCVTAEIEGLPAEWGAMGVHYLHPGMLQLKEGPLVDGLSIDTDPMHPAILLYEPQEDGTMELLGVELLIFQEPWLEAGNDGPPELFAGVAWDTMVDDPDTPQDEAHGFAGHYDIHFWAFRENPLGPTAPFNPTVTCEHHDGTHEH